MREAGGRNRVPLDLRDAWKLGLIDAPRLLVSGRPLTITGGHFYFCNDNESDGVDEVRMRVRQFVKEGVDCIKIMASGGGSASQGSAANVEFAGASGGPTASMPSFTEDELRAAVEEAHKFQLITTAHCEAFDSVRNAANAGIDIIEHCGFILPDGTRGFDEESVKIMASKGLYYCPTFQTGSQTLDELREKKGSGIILTDREKHSLESVEHKYKRKGANLKKMAEMGVKIVAGSDATGIGNSTRLIRAMELMVEEAGLSPMQTIMSATSVGANALKMNHLFGTIRKGLDADIIAVNGDPSSNIRNLRSMKMVMQRGNIISLNNNIT
jgi:imidazolonepropionase-like amidohydrolase